MQKHSVEPPPTVSDLSRKIDIRKELAHVTLWGLAKDPGERPQTACEFSRKLNEVLGRITLDKVPRLKSQPSPQFKRIWVIVATVIFLGIAYAIDVYIDQEKSKRRHETEQIEQKKNALKEASFARGEGEYKRSLERAEREYGSDHPKTAKQVNTLAYCYLQQGKWAQAEHLYRRVLSVEEKAPKESQLRMDSTLVDLAHCCHAQGKLAEAEQLYRRAATIREKLIVPKNQLGDALRSAAICCTEQGKHADAEPMFKRSLELLEQSLGSNDVLTVDTLNRLAECYRRQGKYADAERLKTATVHRGTANEQQ